MESCNTDVFAVNLTTGAVRRVTSHPEYCGRVAFSPDNKWITIMDPRGSGRNMFIAGMRGIPPLIDIVGGILPASTRDNGVRRFFEPYPPDFYGDRGTYFGQNINGGFQGVQGSGAINDPEWNSMADPRGRPTAHRLCSGKLTLFLLLVVVLILFHATHQRSTAAATTACILQLSPVGSQAPVLQYKSIPISSHGVHRMLLEARIPLSIALTPEYTLCEVRRLDQPR